MEKKESQKHWERFLSEFHVYETWSPDSRYFDSHIHLNSKILSEEFEKNSKNYEDWYFNNVSTNINDFRTAIEQSRKHKNIFVTAGLHPLELEDVDLDAAMNEIEENIKNGEKIIAIGETGFDFYRVSKEEAFELQKKSFLKHFELAKKYSLPLMLHIRNAHSETLKILRSLPEHFGVIHCFSGDENIAKKYANLPGNWMISMSPVVFRDIEKYELVVQAVGIEKLLVETDAPYLCHKSEKIWNIINFISDSLSIPFFTCKSILWNNFCTFFNLKL